MDTGTRNAEINRSGDHEALYGRRVEVDRSWTVYHVFTGVPANVGCGIMTGLSRADATGKMMSLNRHTGARAWPCTAVQKAQAEQPT